MRLPPLPTYCRSLKKRSFLLPEVLIAIFLTSLCLIPLIRSPIESYRTEVELLEEMERERLAEWSFSEIKEKLLTHEIPWEKLPTKGNLTAPIPLSPITIQIPGLQSKTVNRSFVLKCRETGEKEGPQGEIYRMLYVDLLFDPPLPNTKRKNPHYSYRTLVQKKSTL